MRAYFAAYAVALKNQSFQCWYIDAFAGTGERLERRHEDRGASGSLFGEEAESVANAKDGSVRIALEIDPPFTRYVFIDRSVGHIQDLKVLRSEYPNRQIEVIYGDANEELVRLCQQTNWRGTRAAVFVDPYGMQVSWSTLEHLAKTQAVDIALLFPTGSLNRLLKRDGEVPDEWARRIDDHLGPCDWRSALYRPAHRKDLFDTSAAIEKSFDFAGLQAFVANRLRRVFPYVHEDAVPLRNSKGSVLFDLFIVCANPSEKAISLVRKLAKGAIRAATRLRT